MNIKLNNKPVYSKYRKTYKDVELTINKEGLYKPVLRNMVTGGATGFGTLDWLFNSNKPLHLHQSKKPSNLTKPLTRQNISSR
jgi:hypothetical protein